MAGLGVWMTRRKLALWIAAVTVALLLVGGAGLSLVLVSQAPPPVRPELFLHFGHSLEVTSVAFSPDDRTLVSASLDNTLKLWDSSSGQLLRTLSGHESAVWSVAFSPDGHTLASASADKTLKLWDTSSGQLLRTLSGHESAVWSVA